MQTCLNGRSCAAVDACISPCHDVTIQNPQNALINIQSVVPQLRQPGGAFLRFSPKSCTLYTLSIPGSVSNATVRVSHVMLNASCVHTRILANNGTLYASSTPGGVSNAMVGVSHVMLNASCVHTRNLWPGMRVLRVRPHVKGP